MAAFIWDIDGTLVDSYPAIVPAVLEACGEFGLSFDSDKIYSEIIRTSVGTFIKQASAAHNLDPVPIQARFDALNDSRIDMIRAVPHAKEALQLLTEAGHSHFVFTHRGASCRSILKNTDLLPFFTEVVTALDGFPRKPSPDAIFYLMKKHNLSPARCFYIGDRSLDIEAAVNAGIGSIMYLDPASPSQASGKETYVVNNLLDICALDFT